MEILVEYLSHGSLALGDSSATDVESEISEELIDSVYDVICNQAVKTDKEMSSQVVLHIVDMSQPEQLVTLRVVPGGEMIKIEALLDGGQDVTKDSAHKGKIIFVHWIEDGNIVAFLSLNQSG